MTNLERKKKRKKETLVLDVVREEEGDVSTRCTKKRKKETLVLDVHSLTAPHSLTHPRITPLDNLLTHLFSRLAAEYEVHVEATQSAEAQRAKQ